MSKLDLIRENLFLGDFCAAAEILKNGSSEISHVLKVLHSPSISTLRNGKTSLASGNLLYSLEHTGKDLKITRMAVFAHDEHWENLLDLFHVCLDFIDAGRRSEKGVLVHCFAGQSRSASIVIAYLMRTEKLSVEDALASLRQSSNVSPNQGFLKQLDLFERMNFKVDRSSPIYKRFRLKALGFLYSQDKKFDRLKLRADPEKSSSGGNTFTYQCKRCRRVVLFQDQVMDHTPEPMSWMNVVEDGVSQGKLMCPNCNARLGSFDWSGSYCSCGSKIVPAFQLQLSRVDVLTVKDEAKKKMKKKKK
ncbi:hypothetical protein EUTSA_v10005645mg [Eutrema salsugineum]|uniref:protein-tyrosine-phosphatase n=1 Tax=Eutrema salsugineum TaxID=72664 RepID=V4KRV0_EUTSA|nr:hypothetical protein EUTSA_v10005645mg [Eutrema salsugineum]